MQCKALRDSAREIQGFDVAYFMASVDTLEDNTAFAAEHEATFRSCLIQPRRWLENMMF